MAILRVVLALLPLVFFILFCVFVSEELSNRISFFALMASILFMGVALYFLCWILERDTGTRQMREIADTIKEGSEGFFIT